MPAVQKSPDNSSTHESYALIAEIREVATAEGRIWQFISNSAELVDHAWLQRQRLLQLSNGAAAIETCWQPDDATCVVNRFQPLQAYEP